MIPFCFYIQVARGIKFEIYRVSELTFVVSDHMSVKTYR
jgi:hypothetical protein